MALCPLGSFFALKTTVMKHNMQQFELEQFKDFEKKPPGGQIMNHITPKIAQGTGYGVIYISKYEKDS